MSQFDDFLEEVRLEVASLVDREWSDLRGAALADAKAFVESVKSDLARWTSLLASNQLTRQDFEFLVQAKKELAVLEGLKRAGLLQVRLDKFRSGLIDAVVGAAIKMLL